MDDKTTSDWVTAAIGERAPARTLVAVRASAPVAAMPPKTRCEHVPDPQAHQLRVRVVFGPGHAVRNDRRQERLDGAEQRDGDGCRQQRANLGERNLWPPGQRSRGQDRGNAPHLDAVDDCVKAAANRRDLEAGHEVDQGGNSRRHDRDREQGRRDAFGDAR